MKKLSLRPDELCVESFGTLPPAQARGTVRGAANTFAETCTCPDTFVECADTLSPSCPHTCGIVISGPAANGGEVPARPSWDCPCM